MLEINNLHVKLEEQDKVILRGVDLKIGAGEVRVKFPTGGAKAAPGVEIGAIGPEYGQRHALPRQFGKNCRLQAAAQALAAAAVSSQPCISSRGRNVTRESSNGKKAVDAFWAAAAVPASRPVATE